MKRILNRIFGRWYIVSILDKDRQPMFENVKVKFVPRHGELMYFEEGGQYYRVLNVFHYINKTHGIFIIVDKISVGDIKPD